jgi:hypothetical protein
MDKELYSNIWKDEVSKKIYKKPRKIAIYIPEIQEEAYKIAKQIVIQKMKEYNKNRKVGRIIRATTFGSVLYRNLGIYCREYKGLRLGSDIDVLCVANKGFKAPKSWKVVVKRGHYSEFEVDRLENHIPLIEKKKIAVNPIHFIIFIPGVNNRELAEKFMPVDVAKSRKKGLKIENWYIDKN